MTAISSADRLKAEAAAHRPLPATPVSDRPFLAALEAGTVGMAAGTASTVQEPGKLFPKVHFAELLKEKTAALTEAMIRRFALADVDTRTPVQLDVAADGAIVVRSGHPDGGHPDGNHPDEAQIERLFAEDPDFANQYREVASGHAFLAAGRVSEQFRLELDEAGTEEERKWVYRRHEPLFQRLERIGGQMTLETTPAGGRLSSAALDMASALPRRAAWAPAN